MYSSRTVFVLGSGASCEVGLPTGPELANMVVDRLNLRLTENLEVVHGDAAIAAALFALSRPTYIGILPKYMNAAYRVCGAMPLVHSIDTFMHQHADDSALRLCGKLAIYRSILEAERTSSLFSDDPKEWRPYFKMDHLRMSWLPRFFKTLNSEVTARNVEGLFDNITIINFNYDRCIEHFLVQAVINVYGLDRAASERLVGKLKIYHPYGTLGKLPAHSAQDGVDFGGGEVDVEQLLQNCRSIRTFTERLDDDDTVDRMRGEIEFADKVVFLGFAFHRQNLELILRAPDLPNYKQRVFATGLNISEHDREAVASELQQRMMLGDVSQAIVADCSCAELFDNYRTSLTVRVYPLDASTRIRYFWTSKGKNRCPPNSLSANFSSAFQTIRLA